jgi:transcriptional regulator with XRE-family HTH domain
MGKSGDQKERIKEFIKYLKIPTKTFEEKAGLSNGYVSSIRIGIGYNANKKIAAAYPELNIVWLLTGEGSMLKSQNEEVEDCENKVKTRMLEYVETEGINKSQFYKKINVSNGFLDKGENVGSDKIIKFLKIFRDVNPKWLLIGEGPMLLKNELVEESRTSYGCPGCKERRNEIERLKIENEKLIEKVDKQNQRLGRLELLLELNDIEIK